MTGAHQHQLEAARKALDENLLRLQQMQEIPIADWLTKEPMVFIGAQWDGLIALTVLVAVSGGAGP